MLVGLAGAAGAVAWRRGQGVAATLDAVVAATGLYLAWAGYTADRREAQAGTPSLPEWRTGSPTSADRRGRTWSDVAKRRGLNQPPLAVSWRSVDPALVQPWAYLQRLVTAGAGWPGAATSPGA